MAEEAILDALIADWAWRAGQCQVEEVSGHRDAGALAGLGGNALSGPLSLSSPPRLRPPSASAALSPRPLARPPTKLAVCCLFHVLFCDVCPLPLSLVDSVFQKRIVGTALMK